MSHPHIYSTFFVSSFLYDIYPTNTVCHCVHRIRTPNSLCPFLFYLDTHLYLRLQRISRSELFVAGNSGRNTKEIDKQRKGSQYLLTKLTRKLSPASDIALSTKVSTVNLNFYFVKLPPKVLATLATFNNNKQQQPHNYNERDTGHKKTTSSNPRRIR